MSEEARNTEIARAAFQAWNDSKGTGVDAWLSVMTDDVAMASIADGDLGFDFTKRRKGHDETRAYIEEINAQMEMQYYRAEDFIAQGDRVVVLSSVSFMGRATGKLYSGAKADVLRFRDGKICEFFEFYDTAMAERIMTPDP